MKIRFLNNEGGGFADYVVCEDGMSVLSFLAGRVASSDLSRYTITVNGMPVTADHVLRDGDRLSVVPRKVEGGSF